MGTGVLTPRSFPTDVPSWLKSLRLHKYAALFSQMTYEEMMTLTEQHLESQVLRGWEEGKEKGCLPCLTGVCSCLLRKAGIWVVPGRASVGHGRPCTGTPCTAEGASLTTWKGPSRKGWRADARLNALLGSLLLPRTECDQRSEAQNCLKYPKVARKAECPEVLGEGEGAVERVWDSMGSCEWFRLRAVVLSLWSADPCGAVTP